MKDELPENYNKPTTKAEDVKTEPGTTGGGKDATEQGEGGSESKAGVKESKGSAEDKVSAETPSEGNVATAAAAALASAAVKAKVLYL